MKLLRFHQKIFALVTSVAFMTFISLAMSQPPAVPAEGPADSKKSAPASRVKPQVIYHLSKSSSDAAALHAQAKAENNALPIDSSMPISLQLAHANANAAAAQATSPTPNAQNQLKATGDQKQPRNKTVAKKVKTRSPAGTRSVRTAPAKVPGARHGNNP
jgi:hypothetical protein